MARAVGLPVAVGPQERAPKPPVTTRPRRTAVPRRYLSARNIPYLNLKTLDNINARDILRAKKLVRDRHHRTPNGHPRCLC